MRVYEIWIGRKSNGDLQRIAIATDVINKEDEGEILKAEDFFPPSTTDIKKEGEIQITGEIYLLSDCLEVVY